MTSIRAIERLPFKPIYPSTLSPGEIKFEGYLVGLLYAISIASGIQYIVEREPSERLAATVMVLALLSALLIIFLLYRGFLQRKKSMFWKLGIDPEEAQKALARVTHGVSFRA